MKGSSEFNKNGFDFQSIVEVIRTTSSTPGQTHTRPIAEILDHIRRYHLTSADLGRLIDGLIIMKMDRQKEEDLEAASNETGTSM